MGMQILFALLLHSLDPNSSKLQTAALGWICVQSVFSYFFSGLRKMKDPLWWSGDAPLAFIGESRVAFPALKRKLLGFNSSLKWIGLGILFYEVAFPFAVHSRSGCAVFLGLGIAFHFGVFLLFGLNRFFWVWVSTYPAIFWWSARI